MNTTSGIIHADYYLSHLKHAGKLLYLINPYDTSFEFAHQVPDYHQQVWISFFVLIALEQVILLSKNDKSFRLNDHVTSLAHWILQETVRIFFRGAEYYAYIKIYENYRYSSLPWDSPWTWYITAVGVDFCYYWVHRANHEINFLWAHHQVHHSSEEFNLVVGLRQSVLQQWCSFFFYLPLALVIPPSHFIAHHQFNLIYQLWIHTTVISDLGVLELVLNTPKHHRVHHGSNLSTLDKNYGGVFIVWDKLFNTFAVENPKEKLIYGLTVQPTSLNPLYLQGYYTLYIFKKFMTMKSFNDKLSLIWKGPSWMPGTPRLGLDQYKVNVSATPREKYNPAIAQWQKVYIVWHFFMVLYSHFQLYDKRDLKNFTSETVIINNIVSLTTIGLLFDKFTYTSFVELTRCIVYTIFLYKFTTLTLLADQLIFYSYLLSCAFWTIYTLCPKRSVKT